jgi:hypothetical protein
MGWEQLPQKQEELRHNLLTLTQQSLQSGIVIDSKFSDTGDGTEPEIVRRTRSGRTMANG